jgi:hypothetical protein
VPRVDLFREGEHADFWWELVDGAIDLVRHVGREDVLVARMDLPGRWAGGFRAWDEQGVYLAIGRGVTGWRVLRVPAEVLRERSDSWFPFAGHLVPHRPLRRIDGTPAKRSDHPGYSRRRPRARNQQSGISRDPGSRFTLSTAREN